MPTVNITRVSQVSTSSDGTTANMGIYYNIGGPQTEVDFVQLYAVNAAAADPSLVGAANFVTDFDVNPADPDYYQNFTLQAGTIYTLFLCPRSGSQESPDEDFNGEYWEASCESWQVTTTTTPPSGTGLVPPKIVSVVPQPARVNQGNSITIAWSTPSTYQQFQIAPIWNGQALQQGTTTGNPAPESWTTQTAPGQQYSFAVQGGVYDGAAGNYTWSAFGPRVNVTAAENLRSLRQYLQDSGINPVGAVLSKIKSSGDTLRQFMQL
jgi:hypothetical protein